MKTILLLFLTLFGLNSFAEDGPRFLRVENINTKHDANDISESVLSFEGNSAEIFRKSLPPIVSTYPNLDKHINELVFLDEKTKQSVMISCANAKVNQRLQLEKFAKTKCTIRLMRHNPSIIGIEKDYGDATELTSPICKKI